MLSEISSNETTILITPLIPETIIDQGNNVFDLTGGFKVKARFSVFANFNVDHSNDLVTIVYDPFNPTQSFVYYSRKAFVQLLIKLNAFSMSKLSTMRAYDIIKGLESHKPHHILEVFSMVPLRV